MQRWPRRAPTRWGIPASCAHDASKFSRDAVALSSKDLRQPAYGRPGQDAITLSQSHGTKSFDDSYQSMIPPNQQRPRNYLRSMDDCMGMPIIGAAPMAPALAMIRVAYGHCSLRVALSPHVLCGGRLDPVSRRCGQLFHAHGHLSG